MSEYTTFMYKDCVERSISMESASSSPGSCSSNDAVSLSRSISSDCLSLTCTETDIGDMHTDDIEVLADELHELGGSCADVARFFKQSPESRAAAADVRRLISDDLRKQDDLRRVACTAGCASIRRLPAQHRSLIVGWMRQVTTALKLHLSTLFSATSILDRYVAAAAEMPADGLLQLLALTCMSVAVKYNEVGQVQPAVWIGLAVGPSGSVMYSTRDLQRFEFTLLQTISWKLHEPDTCAFMELFLVCLPQAPAAHTGATRASTAAESARPTPVCPVTRRALVLAEMTLTHDNFLSYDYSTVALACMAVAEQMVVDEFEPVIGSGGWHRRPAAATAAAAAVVATSGLGLERLAPGLEPCAEALEKCYGMLVQGKACSNYQ